ncbi:hypothetical protein HDU76_002164 [Blyttiomyces sp. JEL0837]|nr:hypothetical protein HDU76_002164 [Blyttiomyces sp. JEL0837]
MQQQQQHHHTTHSHNHEPGPGNDTTSFIIGLNFGIVLGIMGMATLMMPYVLTFWNDNLLNFVFWGVEIALFFAFVGIVVLEWKMWGVSVRWRGSGASGGRNGGGGGGTGHNGHNRITPPTSFTSSLSTHRPQILITLTTTLIKSSTTIISLLTILGLTTHNGPTFYTTVPFQILLIPCLILRYISIEQIYYNWGISYWDMWEEDWIGGGGVELERCWKAFSRVFNLGFVALVWWLDGFGRLGNYFGGVNGGGSGGSVGSGGNGVGGVGDGTGNGGNKVGFGFLSWGYSSYVNIGFLIAGGWYFIAFLRAWRGFKEVVVANEKRSR